MQYNGSSLGLAQGRGAPTFVISVHFRTSVDVIAAHSVPTMLSSFTGAELALEWP